MANSRKSNSNNLPDRVAARIAPLLNHNSTILIGLSGGLDSVVLLHLLHRLSPHYGWKLTALHVHHGISPNAGDWAQFCTRLCACLAIPLHIEQVDIAPLRVQGIEAAARKLRHDAFSRQDCDFVALAHHADDQAETLLLQLLRGAGVKGASAMPLLRRAGSSVEILRPLLHISRSEILSYANEYGLEWIEDESNGDDYYPRNFLRHRLLPVMEEKFPAYRQTLARSAQYFAEASELLDDLARMDAGVVPDGGEMQLNISRLQILALPRAKNLLRYFLHQQGALMPQSQRLDDMLHQLCNAREDAAVCIRYGEWQVRRYRGRVYALAVQNEFDRDLVLHWNGEEELFWPALNARLTFTTVQNNGISLKMLQRGSLTLRLRRGGETVRPNSKSSVRTLKNLLQEHAVPPWQRERLPLLYCGEELVCIPDVAIAAEYQAVDEPGIRVEILPGNY